MISVSPKHRVFLAIEPIDFRKGLDGIFRLCQNQFHQDPLADHYFIFRNKRKTVIKMLYYDSQVFFVSKAFIHWTLLLLAERQYTHGDAEPYTIASFVV